MTEATATDDEAVDLGEYLGKKITSTSVIIKNAGDGLSKSMEIAATVLEPGTRGQVLLDFVVEEHKLKLIEKADSYEMKQVFRAETVILVDDQNSRRKLAAQRNRLERLAEEKKGTQRIPGTEDAIDGQPPEGGLRPVPDWDENHERDEDEHADEHEHEGDEDEREHEST